LRRRRRRRRRGSAAAETLGDSMLSLCRRPGLSACGGETDKKTPTPTKRRHWAGPFYLVVVVVVWEKQELWWASLGWSGLAF